MGSEMSTELFLAALQMALLRRGPVEGLLHHSDRGSQYCSKAFQDALCRHDIECSMSRKGNCYDNAVMESFFATLKKELIHQRSYECRASARASVFEYIETFYNRCRLHSALGYHSPQHYEQTP